VFQGEFAKLHEHFPRLTVCRLRTTSAAMGVFDRLCRWSGSRTAHLPMLVPGLLL
jgi:hypothetical protein